MRSNDFRIPQCRRALSLLLLVISVLRHIAGIFIIFVGRELAGHDDLDAIMGSPSGTAATATDKDERTSCRSAKPRNQPMPNTMPQKWLMAQEQGRTRSPDLLKEMVPRISRVAVMFGTGTAPGQGLYYLRSLQAEAHSKHLQTIGIRVKSPSEIEEDVRRVAREPDGALIVTPDLTTTLYRDAVIRTTLRYRVPAMYPFRYVAAEGGLISYGVDVADQYRHAAEYVDRILKGAKPRELPVQVPTKFELAINLKTAKALGLTVPPSLLARADEVIE